MWKVADIVSHTRGCLRQGHPQQEVRGVSTDSRTLRAGELFVALPGARFDGHQFIAEAVRRGARAVIVAAARAAALPPVPAEVAVVVVADPLAALQALAQARRGTYGGTVIAVTGSNGKTTVKEMTAAVLQTHYPTFKAPASYNNHIGVPLALLQLPSTAQMAVFELGMNHLGEIRRLCELVQPHVGVLTNIGLAHVGYLGSIERIQEAKGELIEALDASSVAVVNADDPRTLALGRRARGRLVTFGQAVTAEVRGRLLHDAGLDGFRCLLELQGTAWEVHVPLPGRHNLSNALAAAAVGLALAVPPARIVAGLEAYRGVPGRLTVHRLGEVVVVDDTYNANPQSMQAALAFVQRLEGAGRRLAVLGDMLELGEAAPALHAEIGAVAARSGLAYLITVGPLARHMAEGAAAAGMPRPRIVCVEDHEAALAVLRRLLEAGDVVLVKGSRGMAMERVVQGLGAQGKGH
ncbi:MAG: UDP-N-acetylmuramoyl-tripeptide--D-alanyl-D-alanine ligase [Candidatus Tectimicrobiota bacterium]|nr:MAG: UDP-N-acetylmuramoyl-tripeptide--D-alanyl-D-alanine ligase [Candidatus Tectomicrobia bacterium]